MITDTWAELCDNALDKALYKEQEALRSQCSLLELPEHMQWFKLLPNYSDIFEKKEFYSLDFVYITCLEKYQMKDSIHSSMSYN